MKNKIVNSIKEWFPHCVPVDTDATEYTLLRRVADYCIACFNGQHEDQLRAKEAIHINGILYDNGSLHERNAIENEFLERISQAESPASLRQHIDFLPKALRPVYMKTILEN